MGVFIALAVCQGELGALAPQEDGPHPSLFQAEELALPIAALNPHGQLGKHLVVFVNPAVAVLVILAQLSKAIAGFRAEQLRAVVDFPIPILVQGQKAAALGQEEISSSVPSQSKSK